MLSQTLRTVGGAPIVAAVALSALSLGGATARAQVVAADSYLIGPGDYAGAAPPGVALNGQTSASSLGFNAPWQAEAPTVNFRIESDGLLDGGGDPDNGQGLVIPSPGTFSALHRNLYRPLTPAIPPFAVATPAEPDALAGPGAEPGVVIGDFGVLFATVVTFAGAVVDDGDPQTTPNQDYAFAGFTGPASEGTIEGTSGSLQGALIGYTGNTEGDNLSLVIRSKTAEAGGVTDVVLDSNADREFHQVVLGFFINFGDFGQTELGDIVRYWLNPTDFSNGEAGLDATAVASGVIEGYQMEGFASIDRFTVATEAFDRTFFWDEPVLAFDLASLDVISIPGDYDGNGIVDGDDYLVWRSEFGRMDEGVTADGNADGVVDAADYTVWRDNLGESLFFPNGQPAAVLQPAPEPAAAVLLCLGGLLARTRKSCRG